MAEPKLRVWDPWQVRRITRTVVLLVVLGGSLVVAAGWQEPSARRDASTAWPDEHHTPAPRVGDRGTYSKSVLARDATGWQAVEPETATIEFQWLPDERTQDAAGAPVMANRLSIVGLAPVVREKQGTMETWHTYHFVPGEARPFARTLEVQAEHDIRGPVWSDHHTDFEEVPLPCGLRTPWQGSTEVVHDEPVMLLCHADEKAQEWLLWPRWHLEQEGWQWVGLSTQPEPTGDGDADPAPGPEVRVWLREGLPYPVSMEIHEQDAEGRRVTQWRLSHFEAGDRPVGVHPAFEPGQGPMVARAPPTPQGPEAGGLVHPFPLSDAYALAKEPLAHPDLAGFLDDHPDAIMVWADYREWQGKEGMHRLWSFEVRDRDDAVQMGVLQRMVAEAQPVHEFIGAVPPWQAPWSPVAEEPASYPGSVGPESWPTLQALFDRWYQHNQFTHVASPAEPNVAVNALGFLLACDASCEEATPRFWVGHDAHAAIDPRLAQPDLPSISLTGEATTQEPVRNVLVLDTAGHAVAWHRKAEPRRTLSPDPLGLAGASGPVAAEDGEAPAPLTDSWTPYWSPPAAGEVAVIGAIALLVAAIHWLWPLLRGAPAAPLFTRLSPQELLEHRTRRAFHGLVQAEPGIHTKEIMRRTGKSMGVTEHHLRKLVEGGLLVRKDAAGKVCYFVTGTMDRQEMAALPLLQTDTSRQVMALVQDRPGMTAIELARELGMSRSNLSYHVRRLVGAGVLRMEPEGRRLRLHVTELGRSVQAVASEA